MKYINIDTRCDMCEKRAAKQMHPDSGGNVDDFKKLKAAAEQALQYFDRR